MAATPIQLGADLTDQQISQVPHLSRKRDGQRWFLIASFLIVLLAGSLRAYRIGERSLWLDEAIAANVSRGTLQQTLILTRGLHSAPIVDPFILFTVEKVGRSPLAVRLPAFVFSVLAVVLTLCFAAIPSVGRKSAVLAALMLAVSASQVRYAQEVREYSLSVLFAGLLLYVFLNYLSHPAANGQPYGLYLALFLAPLVQYGLVLFSIGIVTALLVMRLIGHTGVRFRHLLVSGACIGCGGFVSLLLTLRYQWGDDASYLKDYLWTRGTSLPHFVLSNTHHLFTFLLPGLLAASVSAIAILISLGRSIQVQKLSSVALLAITSSIVVLMCAIAHLYPWGPVRQCLFLAPVLCLWAASSLVELANSFTDDGIAIAAVSGVVIVSGFFQFRLLDPYAEIENIQPVLRELQSNIEHGDRAYIYPSSVFAVDFYSSRRDPRFIYGNYHQQSPEIYLSEIAAGAPPATDRLWLIFSHVFRDEDKRILAGLQNDWTIQRVLTEQGAVLYLGTHRPATGTHTPASPKLIASNESADVSVWQWYLNNSRPSVSGKATKPTQ